MNPARYLKDALKRALAAYGSEIYRRPSLPKGTDVFESLRAHWPNWQPRTIFDVGANVGQTVGRLRPLFPTPKSIRLSLWRALTQPCSLTCEVIRASTVTPSLSPTTQAKSGCSFTAPRNTTL